MRLPLTGLVVVIMLASALVLSLAAIASAQNPVQRTQLSTPEELEQQIEELLGRRLHKATRERLAELKQQIEGLRSRINDLAGKIPYSAAFLNCNSKKYVEFRFDGSHLVFFASCENVEPYLEGHKLLLKIGNPYSFNFSNVQGRLQYGKTLVEAVNQQVEISPTETFRSGTWQSLTVIINPSKPEDLRVLWLELQAETAGATR